MKGGRILRPQGLENLDVLVAHRPTARKVRRVQGLKLLAQPAHPDANGHTAARQYIDGRQHFRGEHRITIRQDHDAGDQAQGGRLRGHKRHERQLLHGVTMPGEGPTHGIRIA